MNLTKHLLLAFSLISAAAQALDVKGYSLTQTGLYKYDAALPGAAKTPAQAAVDYLYTLGVRHVNLIPEARMATFDSNTIKPLTPPGKELSLEKDRYGRLISYIHSKGMTVGMRPIILVDRVPGMEAYWHGNIKPQNPVAWFDSLRSYLTIYLNIASKNHVEEFTVAAELYSMTVGIEDMYKNTDFAFGFPADWTNIVQYAKDTLPGARIMYDINYTDVTTNANGSGASGGEFERWRFRLVDMAPNERKPLTMTKENVAAWNQMKTLWLSLDSVGLDMYRSLMPKGQAIPANYGALEATLEDRAVQFATDINSKLDAIETAVGAPKRVIIKEVGFKSCDGCFVDPFTYDDPRQQVNIAHQAAGYEAFMNAFVKPEWPWMQGISWWDISTDPARSGVSDPGFSPRGKPQTESVIKKGWN